MFVRTAYRAEIGGGRFSLPSQEYGLSSPNSCALKSSAGVASSRGRTVAGPVESADTLLHRAKNAGRNRVEVEPTIITMRSMPNVTGRPQNRCNSSEDQRREERPDQKAQTVTTTASRV
jgi:hypothetical protein